MNERIDRLLFAGAIVTWCVAIVAQLLIAIPLRHDEAAFVVGTQRWLAGAPNVWLYRSLGTELLALPGVAAGASPEWIRVVPALFTLLVPIGAWALARAAFPDRHVGGWAAAVLATALPMLGVAADMLGDLPAAGLILVGLAVLVRELQFARMQIVPVPRIEASALRLVLAALALAAGFYVRYGSTPALAAIAGATLVCFPRPRTLLILATAGAVLAIPHIWFSHAQTGEALGVLEVAAGSTRLDYVGQGLITYVTANPFGYYGVLAAPMMLLGLAGVVVLRERTAIYLGLVAIGTLVLLGLRSHAQPRYAFLIVALLVVIGVAMLARLLASHLQLQRAVAFAIAALWIFSLVRVVQLRRARVAAPARIAALGEAIRRDTGGRPCRLHAVRTPQLIYYSGCIPLDWPDAPRDAPTYTVSLPDHPADPLPGSVPVAGTSGFVQIAK